MNRNTFFLVVVLFFFSLACSTATNKPTVSANQIQNPEMESHGPFFTGEEIEAMKKEIAGAKATITVVPAKNGQTVGATVTMPSKPNDPVVQIVFHEMNGTVVAIDYILPPLGMEATLLQSKDRKFPSVLKCQVGVCIEYGDPKPQLAPLFQRANEILRKAKTNPSGMPSDFMEFFNKDLDGFDRDWLYPISEDADDSNKIYM